MLVALAGCKIDTTVTIEMAEDGSGVVRVTAVADAAAVAAAEAEGGKLEDRVRLAGLEEAGWRVTPWARSAEGSAQLELSKRFKEPDQVAGIIAELNGADGPLREFAATRGTNVFSTDYGVTGTIDLQAVSTGIAADPELVANLTGQQVDVNAVDATLLAQLQQALTLKVTTVLPTGAATVTGTAGTAVPVAAEGSVRDTKRIMFVLVGIGLLVLALFVWLKGRHRQRVTAPARRFGV